MHPLRLNRQDIADEYETLLTYFPNVVLAPLRREVLLRAAEIRVRYPLRPPDALIVATAFEHDASLIVTNDDQWKRIESVDVVCLDDC